MSSTQHNYITPRRSMTISLQHFVPIKLLPRSPWESPLEESWVAACLEEFASKEYRDNNEEFKAYRELIDLFGLQLKKNGIPRETEDSEGMTPLQNALYNGNLKIAQILIATGAFSLSRSCMQSPLAMAVNPLCQRRSKLHDVIDLVLMLATTGMTTYQPSFQASIMTAPPTTIEARCSTYLFDMFYPELQSVCRLPSIWLLANPLWWSEDPVLTDILIRSGAFTNRQVFECWFCFANKKRVVVRRDWYVAEIEVLERHSRQVPSLMSLSRLAVSHSIGCGSMAQRAAVIKTLEIPKTLKPYLMFEDLWETVSKSRGSDNSAFLTISDFL